MFYSQILILLDKPGILSVDSLGKENSYTVLINAKHNIIYIKV